MLEVIEPGTAGNLKSGHGADISVQDKLWRGCGTRGGGEAPSRGYLLQHHDDLLGWELSLALRLDVGFHQAFLDGFPLRLEAFQAVRVEEAKPGREPP